MPHLLTKRVKQPSFAAKFEYSPKSTNTAKNPHFTIAQS